ncbi:hypothetical protein BC629DRAFT_323558 [Irpex lacteus]|nr:hypothetical protein BC629DRAFT_323558 [Irpex lacteus]
MRTWSYMILVFSIFWTCLFIACHADINHDRQYHLSRVWQEHTERYNVQLCSVEHVQTFSVDVSGVCITSPVLLSSMVLADTIPEICAYISIHATHVEVQS